MHASQKLSVDPAYSRLASHPAYLPPVVPCGLPPSSADPFPSLTLALFDLWAVLRFHVALYEGMPMLACTPDSAAPNLSPIQHFQAIRTALVSLPTPCHQFLSLY